MTIDDNDFDWDFERMDWRKIEAIFETAGYGTVYLGQGSMSADTITEAHFSGTDVISYVSIPDLAGAMQFEKPCALDDNRQFAFQPCRRGAVSRAL